MLNSGKLIGTTLLGALLLGLAASGWGQEADPRTYEIRLKSRTFVPQPGLELEAILEQGAGDSKESHHFLLQFHEIPGEQEKASLAARGLTLVDYLNGNTFIASATASAMDTMSIGAGRQSFRWAGALTDDDKTSAELKRGEIGKWALTKDQRVVLTLHFHKDVTIEDAEALVQSYGGDIQSSLESIPAITAIFHFDQVKSLASEDAVQSLDVVAPPLGPTNDSARNAANVTRLAGAPYNLSGNGVTLLVYDSGRVDAAHPDLAGRVVQTDGSTIKDHSTHVAGTAAGSGINSNGVDRLGRPNRGLPNQWAGVAPSANLRSFGLSGSFDVLYNSGGDLNRDFTTAITAGVDLATMSLGNNVVSNGFPCGQLGDYASIPILLDNIVRGSILGQKLIYFVAAGNERQGGAPCGQFRTIGSPATAKNVITVGGINSNDNTIYVSSSFGPTDDGRLKPDITAPGCQTSGDFGIKSTSAAVRNGYVVKCGTSMATPVASGAASLLIEQWRLSRGAASRPRPHTVKAILVHTATDRGNVGPDYRFGWGTLNARAAIDLVRVPYFLSNIRVDSARHRETRSYRFYSNGFSPMKVTLAWDDPPASPLAATTLINNLDLVLVDPRGRVYQPFVLNPAAPATVATTGVDRVNNVEMVVAPRSRGHWTAYVTGSSVPTGPQEFTVIVPNSIPIRLPSPIPPPRLPFPLGKVSEGQPLSPPFGIETKVDRGARIGGRPKVTLGQISFHS